jgi:dTDP-glucose 4,6-dehydratase
VSTPLREPKSILVTGGCGFIGSAFIRFLFRAPGFAGRVLNLDLLTYAANPENVAEHAADPRYAFAQGDIGDQALVARLCEEHAVDTIVHFAAESHVDRSILEPADFIRTDVVGTAVLLDAARQAGVGRFVQVSTDEVYGSIPSGAFRETDPISPSSPYSASKAGGDLQVLAWHRTFGLDAVITRGSNTFGPRQYPEKLIPLFVTNALDGEPLPVYGDGMQVRDWIHVEDHCEGIWTAMERGEAGEVYNVGGGNEQPNIAITRRILSLTGRDESLVRHVVDRPGHDRRYALDTARLRDLGWEPRQAFDAALAATVEWYRERRDWWEPIKSGDYRRYYEQQYGAR